MKTGSKHSSTSKKKIAIANTGRVCTKETRIKISLSKIGKNNGQIGINHPMYGRHHTKKSIKKMSLAKKGIYTGIDNPMYGKKISDNVKNRMSKSHRDYWRALDREEYNIRIRNIMRRFNFKPNKVEKILYTLLTRLLPKEYKYVGNGKVILDGFNPDFINCNGQKKIIELYGDYWHRRKDKLNQNIRRKQSYRKLGYQLLIIWEHELENINKVKNKILKFNSKGVVSQC